MSRSFICSLLCAIAALPGLATAAIVQENDSTTFLTSISIDGIQTYDGLTPGPLASPANFAIGPVGFTASAPGGLRAVENTGDPTDLYLTTANPGEALTLDFTGQGINAIGLELFLTELSGSVAVTDVSFSVSNVGGDVLNGSLTSTSNDNFRGFTSDTALTTVVMTPFNPFVYATVDATAIQVIPEPASLALLALGGLALLRRR